MPKYEYACKSCGEHIEVVQTFADAALSECPACGGVLRKVFSSVGIVFKGSGFYRTDSRAAESSGDVKAEKSDKSEKSDKKPADAGSSGGDGGGSAKKEPAKSDSGTKTSGSSGSSSSTPAAAAS